MKDLKLTPYRLAKDMGVPPLRINQIVHGERAITVDTTMRLALFWYKCRSLAGLQLRDDLEVAETTVGEQVKCEVKIQRRPPVGL